MTAGFASVAGSTLVGYALLGAPLPYLLAPSVMNAPGRALHGEDDVPRDGGVADGDLEGFATCATTESANVIDATARGALNGGRIAVIVGCLLIAFISLIALANGLLGGVGEWFGYDGLTFQKVFGWALAPLAWLIGVPWDDAALVGTFIGEKTVINDSSPMSTWPAPAPMSPDVDRVTFALAASPTSRRSRSRSGGSAGWRRTGGATSRSSGSKALLAGSMVDLTNAAIAGVFIAG